MKKLNVQSTVLLTLFCLIIFSVVQAQELGNSLKTLNSKLTSLKTSLETLKTNLGKLSDGLQGKKTGGSGGDKPSGGRAPTPTISRIIKELQNSKQLYNYIQNHTLNPNDMITLLNESNKDVKEELQGDGLAFHELKDVLDKYFEKSKPAPKDVATILNSIFNNYKGILIKNDNEKNSLYSILNKHSKHSSLENLHELFNELNGEYQTYLNKTYPAFMKKVGSKDPSYIINILDTKYVKSNPQDTVMTNLYNFLKEIDKDKYPNFNDEEHLFEIIDGAQIRSSSIEEKIASFNKIAQNDNLFPHIKNRIPLLLRRNIQGKDTAIKLLKEINEKLKATLVQKKDPLSFDHSPVTHTIEILNTIYPEYKSLLEKDNGWIKAILTRLVSHKDLQKTDIQKLSDNYGVKLKEEITAIIDQRNELINQKKQEQEKQEQEKEKRQREWQEQEKQKRDQEQREREKKEKESKEYFDQLEKQRIEQEKKEQEKKRKEDEYDEEHKKITESANKAIDNLVMNYEKFDLDDLSDKITKIINDTNEKIKKLSTQYNIISFEYNTEASINAANSIIATLKINQPLPQSRWYLR